MNAEGQAERQAERLQILAIETSRLNAEKARLDQKEARLDAEKARLDAEKACLNAEKARLEKLPPGDPERATGMRILVLDKEALAAAMQALATQWQALERARGVKADDPTLVTAVNALVTSVQEMKLAFQMERTMNAANNHHYSSSQSTQNRDPDFKANVVEAYGCAVGVQIRCVLTNKSLPAGLVCGSHLFKHAWRNQFYDILQVVSINDVRNGLPLFKPLEEAFDNGYLVIEYREGEGEEGAYIAHWLGNDTLKIMELPHYPWKTNEKLSPDLQNQMRLAFPTETFKELVDEVRLTFSTAVRPYKRCLAYQARKVLHTARSEGRITNLWGVGKNFDTYSPAATNIREFYATIPQGGADDPETEPVPNDVVYDASALI